MTKNIDHFEYVLQNVLKELFQYLFSSCVKYTFYIITNNDFSLFRVGMLHVEEKKLYSLSAILVQIFSITSCKYFYTHILIWFPIMCALEQKEELLLLILLHTHYTTMYYYVHVACYVE